MKLFRLFLIFFPLALSAQPTAHKFCAVFGGAGGYEYAYGAKQTPDGGYIVAGTTNSIGNGITDAYIVKTDTIGLAAWQKTYGGINIDQITALDVLPDSGYIFAGYTNSYGNGGYDGWLLRTDKNGDTLWTKTFGGTDWDLFYSVKCTNDSGFVIAGGTYSNGHGDEDMFLIKTDKNGVVQWTKYYGGLFQDEARAICQYAPDSGYLVAGVTHSLGDTLGDGWLLRLDQAGDSIWGKKFGRPDTLEALNGVSYSPTNGFIVAVGQTESTPGNIDGVSYDLFANGSLIFPPGYNSLAQNDYFRSVAVHRDGRSALVGTTYSFGSGNGDVWFIERNFTGYCYTTFGTLETDEAYSVDTTRDGGYIISGFSDGYNGILPDMYLLKVDSVCGSTTVVGIFDPPSNSDASASAEIYPNPMQSEGLLRIGSRDVLPSAPLHVMAYDLTGRFAGELTGETTNSSAHNATLHLHRGALAAGCYVWKVEANGRALASGKLILTNQ